MLIDIIAGAQPDFIKIASIIDAVHKIRNKEFPFRYRLIYTGQQKSIKPSFYEQFDIPKPQVYLEAGAGTDTEQTAIMMVRYEKVLQAEKPLATLVVSDTNASIACALTAKKNNIIVCHLEAGLRNNDPDTPDEVNRIVTDSVSDIYFTTSHTANENLRATGVSDENIFFLGNTVVDTIQKYQTFFQKPPMWEKLQLRPGYYFVIGLRRPENTEPKKLKALLVSLIRSSQGLPLIFLTYPGISKILESTGIRGHNLFITEFLDYVHYCYLIQNARVVVTDSGNIQDETTIMQVPCITIGHSTERQETVLSGTNELVKPNPDEMHWILSRLFKGAWKKGIVPYMWDGHAGERIVTVLKNFHRLR
jgi:UDP-N-acetylglucosamine 2-epimerase (non-hydrolysing)